MKSNQTDSKSAHERSLGPTASSSGTFTPPPHSADEGDTTWFSSSSFVGWSTILGLLTTYVTLYGFLYTIFTKQEPDNVKITIILAAVATLGLSVASIFELRRNYRLKSAVAQHVQLEALNASERHRLESDIREQHDLRIELLRSRDQKEVFIGELFRDLARARATHSLMLYALQEMLFASRYSKEAFFEKSWERQRAFLDEYCTTASRLFTTLKGKQCCVNVKIVWDFSSGSTLNDSIQSVLGIDPKTLTAARAVYQTIARCFISRNDSRLVGDPDRIERRSVQDNMIFRKLFSGGMIHFISNNIRADREKWLREASAGQESLFSYPDDATTAYYTKIMVVPIAASMDANIQGFALPNRTERLIGFLSLDTLDTSIEFDKLLDLALITQIAFDIASSFCEYLKCIRCLQLLEHRNMHG
jgi:hypothetical protein